MKGQKCSMNGKNQYKVEELLNIKLPGSAREINYYKWQPNPDLMFFESFIKFKLPRDEYDLLIRKMNLFKKGRTPETDVFFSRKWHGPEGSVLSWWNPDSSMPDNAAANTFGINGWIITKYEKESIYIFVTDACVSEGTPGPW
ncbi:MAG: hypothetical protein ACMUJM_18760 [bacterium]